MSESPEGDAQPYKPVTRWFVIFMVRTRKGLGLLDRLGRWRVSKPLGWLMLALMPIAALVALYLVAFLVSVLYFSPQSATIVSNVRTISPLANFLLPGINPYLPLSVWLAIVVAVFIHEASHGIVARNVGMKVKAAGVVLLAFLPIGAFVEVDDKELKQSKSRDSLRVLAAGSGINFVVGIACILLLILTVSSMTPAAKGAGIYGVVPDSPTLHSPAYLAGIQPGDFVLAINNSPVTDLGVLHSGNYSIGEKVNVTVWHDGKTRVVPITLANYTVTTVNETSGRSTSVSYPFLGVDQASYASLQAVTTGYATLYKASPLAYISYIPTFQRVELYIPFSSDLAGFYTSPLGALTPAVTNTLFWLFFVNFNLAIFNSLPIYLMDGGQAFEIFLRGAGKGRISEDLARRLTTGTTLALVFALFILIAGPYITGAFAPT
ncbi:MAG TPA: site-2 protease family protein [Nitrososphaerales archaeon]|nr:site-2 protease family protein [Nitrososphaerales archaeon]